MSIRMLAAEAVGETPILRSDNAAAAKQLGFEDWMPYAAEFWSLSKDIKDYFLVPVPIIYTELPNRNGIAFPLEELVKWNKVKGAPAYMGWKGMPVHVEHDWDGESIGVIPDVSLQPLRSYGNGKVFKVITLLAIDRTKNEKLGKQIESGERNTYSMGCLVDSYSCGHCHKEMGKCSHLNTKSNADFREEKGKLVFRRVHGIEPVEVSSVADPAYGCAAGDVRGRY